MSKIIPLDSVLTLMLSGAFGFNAKSIKTNVSFSFYITYNNNDDNPEWNVFTLGFRESIGKIIIENKNFVFYYRQLTVEEEKVWKIKQLGFTAIFNIVKKQLENKVEIRSNGKCARCGRTLTNLESIDMNIGPECEKKNKQFIQSLANKL